MKKYKLVEIDTEKDVPVGEVQQIKLTKSTKFLMYVDVTNIAPHDVIKYMKRAMEGAEDFFGKNDVLYIPRRQGDVTSVVEIVIDEA